MRLYLDFRAAAPAEKGSATWCASLLAAFCTLLMLWFGIHFLPARPQDFPVMRRRELARDVQASANPGEFPYTRGIYPDMYRSRLWTMRQYAGFGTAEESNRRYRYLLSQGTTGLSVAFDLPTQMGLDSDHPLAAGEVGPRRRGHLLAGRHGAPVPGDSAARTSPRR